MAVLKYHPDKARPDESKNETMEMLNDRWVEMSKAYGALLDDEIRNNWMQYGHPDGKQSFSIGIALPKFMISEGNGKYVLLFYAVVLGVALPYVVGKWWYGTQALTKDGVIIASAGKMFKEYKEEITVGGVAAATSTGEEFHELLKGPNPDAGLSKIEKNVVAAESRPSEKDQLQLKEIKDPFRRKVLALLWAYLARVDLGDPALEKEKYAVAPIAFRLNDSFTSIALAFGIVAPLISSYHASQRIIQALLPDASPLLQLPHFTQKRVEAVEGDGATSHMSLQKFMSLPQTTRRKLASGLSDSEYATALQVAQQMPHFVVAKAFFKVIGDKVITPSALVQLVVKGRIIPPGTKNIPEVNPTDLEDVDPEEGDLDALLGRTPAKSRKRKPIDEKAMSAINMKGNSVQPPLAHAPYFARDHSPRWRVFLTDARAGRIGVPPFTFTEFEKPIFDADYKPTFNMQTFKCQFQAPPQVGQFAFKMHLICDSYVGLDSSVDVLLDVQDFSKAEVVESEEDISEPEEDSLAGQVQAMKGGAVKKGKSKGKKKAEADDSEEDDESDTEGEVDDTSDTDTETDED
jgi:translocation protein SEC63